MPGFLCGFEDAEDSKAAVISDCGAYRYVLRRGCVHGSGYANFIMLNPSVADAYNDDPTIRRCISYGRNWGYADIIVTNLFALRSTDPRALKSHPDPIGPDNDRYIIEAAKGACEVICAWGAEPMAEGRAPVILGMLRNLGIIPRVLGFTKSGQPLHPLFKPGHLEATPWEG
jgi:hypothetical protein